MTIPTHLLAGLIIGKITGDYPTAILGSLTMDFDHIISYLRHGILFKPRRLYQALINQNDPWGDQRNIIHSLITWTIVTIFLLLINPKFGATFSIAYFSHLVFDALDKSTFYPFFPSKKFAIAGIIKYYSRQEVFFDLCLVSILLTLFYFT